jgi:hypothetical protein
MIGVDKHDDIWIKGKAEKVVDVCSGYVLFSDNTYLTTEEFYAAYYFDTDPVSNLITFWRKHEE